MLRPTHLLLLFILVFPSCGKAPVELPAKEKVINLELITRPSLKDFDLRMEGFEAETEFINKQYFFDFADRIPEADKAHFNQELRELALEEELHLFFFLLPGRGNITSEVLHEKLTKQYDLDNIFKKDYAVVYYFLEERSWYANAGSKDLQFFFAPVVVKNIYEKKLKPVQSLLSTHQLVQLAMGNFIKLAKNELPTSYFELSNRNRDKDYGATDEENPTLRLRVILISLLIFSLIGGGYFYYQLGIKGITGSGLSFIIGWLLIILFHWILALLAMKIYGQTDTFYLVRVYIVLSGIFQFGLYPTVVAATSSSDFSLGKKFKSRYLKEDGDIDFDKYFKDRR